MLNEREKGSKEINLDVIYARNHRVLESKRSLNIEKTRRDRKLCIELFIVDYEWD